MQCVERSIDTPLQKFVPKYAACWNLPSLSSAVTKVHHQEKSSKASNLLRQRVLNIFPMRYTHGLNQCYLLLRLNIRNSAILIGLGAEC